MKPVELISSSSLMVASNAKFNKINKNMRVSNVFYTEFRLFN